MLTVLSTYNLYDNPIIDLIVSEKALLQDVMSSYAWRHP